MTKKPDQAAPDLAQSVSAAPPLAAPDLAPPHLAGRPPAGRSLAAADLLSAARACYGGLLLCAPGRMISLGAGHPAGPRAAAVARVLGARHLLQAAATAGVLAGVVPSPGIVRSLGVEPSPGVVPGAVRQVGLVPPSGVVPSVARAAGLQRSAILLAGSAVDALHAASMVGLAAVCPRYRRAVVADVLLEAGFAAFGIMTARRLRRSWLR